jgi:hypothetical protein
VSFDSNFCVSFADSHALSHWNRQLIEEKISNRSNIEPLEFHLSTAPDWFHSLLRNLKMKPGSSEKNVSHIFRDAIAKVNCRNELRLKLLSNRETLQSSGSFRPTFIASPVISASLSLSNFVVAIHYLVQTVMVLFVLCYFRPTLNSAQSATLVLLSNSQNVAHVL